MEQKKDNKEIFPGMSVEEIKALYFDKDALKEPSYKIYQLNSEGYRYYYRFDENGVPTFYPSVTTLLSAVLPTPKELIDWMIKNGKEGSTEKKDLAASYGTFMHSQFEELIINRHYDFDAVPEVLFKYMERENIPERCFNEWLIKIRKDVLAFAQFVKDWNVRPLAVEIGLVHPKYGYAGCLDLPCRMTDPKTFQDFGGIVDFKSGRKGFYEEHELQLGLYLPMWNVNFPDCPLERTFNFSPKDWRKKPSYNLQEQTNAPSLKKLPHLLELAAIEDGNRDNTLTIIRGTLDLDNGDLMDNIKELTLSELIISRKKEKTPDVPKETAESEIKPSDGVSGDNPIVDTPEGEKSDSTANSEEIKGVCQYYGNQCFCADCNRVFDTHKSDCYNAELKSKYMPDTKSSLLNDDSDM